MRILIVEDDYLIANGIQLVMESCAYAVDVLDNGKHAIQALQNEQFDLVILDVGLPGLNGFEVLAQLRKISHNNANIPVLMLTARDAIEDRVKGLDVGADDYLIKPFDISELQARVRALIRRNKGRSSSVIEYNEIRVDPQSHTVEYKNQAIDISPKEFSVLVTLLENQGKVVSKSKLEESTYSWDHEVESNALEVHIHHLRKKIDSKFIKTIRNSGYIIP